MLTPDRGGDPAAGLTSFAVDGHQFGLLHSVSKFNEIDRPFAELDE